MTKISEKNPKKPRLSSEEYAARVLPKKKQAKPRKPKASVLLGLLED